MRRFEHVAAHQPRTAYPQALNAHIIDPRVGVVGDDMAAGYVVSGVAVMLAQRRQDLQISGVTFFDDFAYWCDRGVDGDRIYRFQVRPAIARAELRWSSFPWPLPTTRGWRKG